MIDLFYFVKKNSQKKRNNKIRHKFWVKKGPDSKIVPLLIKNTQKVLVETIAFFFAICKVCYVQSNKNYCSFWLRIEQVLLLPSQICLF